VSDWYGDFVRVACDDPQGAPLDVMFAMLAATGWEQRYDEAFTWGSRPTTDSYVPLAAYTANPVGQPRDVVVTRLSAGHYRVAFPGMGSGGGNVQVTAYGTQSGDCQVIVWGTSFADVQCVDVNGAPADRYFTIRYFKPF
jgi:hypothetical protein